MRRIDKKLNMMKANLLAESRYLESKGLIKEGNFSGPQKTDPDIDELAREIIKITKGDMTKENDAIVSTANGDGDIQRRLTSRVQQLKNSEKIDESDLSTYKGEMSKSGDYPFTRNVGDHQKADRLERLNKENRKAFEEMFNKEYSSTIIKTSDGDYTFESLQFRNNHGNYNVVFKKPSNGGFMNSTLIISYDQNNGYYVSDKGYDVNGRKIEVNLDDESAKKVTEMLKYNK